MGIRTLACLALGTFLAANAAADDAARSWSVSYDVKFGPHDATPHHAEVSATLTWRGAADHRPASVLVRMAHDGFPGGYGPHVRSFRPTDGSDEAASDADAAHRLSVGADGCVRFAYTVVLDHDATGYAAGPDEAPYRFAGGAFWTGRSLFAGPDDGGPAVARFAAADGGTVACSFEPSDDGTYRATESTRFRECFLVEGKFERKEIDVAGTHVTVALGPELTGWMPRVESALRDFLDSAANVWGGPPGRRALVAGNRGLSHGLDGGVFGSDVSFLVGDDVRPEDTESWTPFVCHELFHLWNPKTVGFDSQQYWWTEGVTDFYASALLARDGKLGVGELVSGLRNRVRSYAQAAGAESLVAAGEHKFEQQALVYDGGFLAALCLDVRIRVATGGKRCLDDVLRDLYGRAHGGRLISRQDLADAASKAAGAPLGPWIEEFVGKGTPLPLEETFRRLGLRLTVVSEDLPEMTFVAFQMLGLPSVVDHGRGVEVLRSERSEILPGDVIVAAGGDAIDGSLALRRALRDTANGDSVRLVVLRSGVPTAIVLTARWEGGPARRVKAILSIALDPDPDAKAGAPERFRAVFGVTLPQLSGPK